MVCNPSILSFKNVFMSFKNNFVGVPDGERKKTEKHGNFLYHKHEIKFETFPKMSFKCQVNCM